MIYYFAYGSNLSLKRLETDRLEPEGVTLAARRLGRLDGYELLFNKRSIHFPGAAAANIQRNALATTFGTLNQMPAAGLDILDKYEGVASGQYQQMQVSVLDVEKGIYINAITYIALNNLGAGLLPKRRYLDYLLDGRDLLPADYIARLADTKFLPE